MNDFEQDIMAKVRDLESWKILRDLLGHVQDGSAEPVTISQDDATKNWHVRVGSGMPYKVFYGSSLEEALRQAVTKTPEQIVDGLQADVIEQMDYDGDKLYLVSVANSSHKEYVQKIANEVDQLFTQIKEGKSDT